MNKKAIMLTILLLNTPNTVLADVYKWTDEQGNLHATNDLSTAPIEIQEKYATPVETLELPKPKPTETPGRSKFNFYQEGIDKKNGYTVITTDIERVKKEPSKFKYKWTTDNGITFYTNRIIEDNDSSISILPKDQQPHGKFTRIIFN